MPSMIIGAISGGVNILSGYGALYSGGRAIGPVGGVQLRLASTASGLAYVGLSGGVTAASGGVNNFSGALDGIYLSPGDAMFVPRIGLGGFGPNSGNPQLYVTTDAAASGQARLFWEVY